VRDQQEPLMGREGLFRQKLNMLRKTGRVQQQSQSDTQNRLKELEQGSYLTNVQSTLSQTDPKEMERITLLDNVTQFYNHNTITRIISDELKRSKRYKHDCTLLMFLVDGLYGIQQSHGHDVADSILRGVSDFVMRTIRDVDVPARYSAEQMLVLCPETDAQGTSILAERMRSKIQLERVSDLTQNWHVTLSLGIASFPAHCANYDEMFQKLEKALNTAVDKGGNCVVISD
jgi:diguanylate cyclase (GGDEF)-like protein